MQAGHLSVTQRGSACAILPNMRTVLIRREGDGRLYNTERMTDVSLSDVADMLVNGLRIIVEGRSQGSSGQVASIARTRRSEQRTGAPSYPATSMPMIAMTTNMKTATQIEHANMTPPDLRPREHVAQITAKKIGNYPDIAKGFAPTMFRASPDFWRLAYALSCCISQMALPSSPVHTSSWPGWPRPPSRPSMLCGAGHECHSPGAPRARQSASWSCSLLS
jgi:hypothetical protein